ncbi:hypothetical protein ABMX90_14670 [Vibrio vulnificus]|uniref:hypothetical protein n=1 Tax=Vibrio vulnificus TaxID=672 RepID=UPI00285FB005|nr:hypothetical protein [Vibrio vulnificus]ELC9582602.1 hypothetical protein [Vibrio vulnificus]
MSSVTVLFNDDFIREIILNAITGLFGLLETAAICGFAWAVYRRHLHKKAATKTAYNALVEIQARTELEKLYCKEINSESPDSVKIRVRKQAARDGLLFNPNYTPAKLANSIHVYERKCDEELPSITAN